MLAYKCRNCGRFSIWPLVNEFNECFCNEKCYKKFCEKNNYNTNLEELKIYKYIGE